VTYAPELVEQALQLRASGRAAMQIARDLGVPRGTVRDWLAGRTPRAARIGPTCPLCGEAAHRFERLPDAYVYLLGLYLGAGCISAHPRGVFRLRVVLDAAYPSIIDQAAEAIRHVRPRNAVGRRRREYNDIEVSSYSKAWPCLLPQHGPGKKHERRIVLQPWQHDLARRAPHLLVRGLIHSDGCRFVNTGRDGWALAEVRVRLPFRRHPSDLRRRLRAAQRAPDHLRLDRLRVAQGRRGVARRTRLREGVSRAVSRYPVAVPRRHRLGD
jgi:hypothetical protein